MRIKRYEAADMTEALRQVKEELGPDAVILSARTFNGSRGFSGILKKSRVELTVAVDVPGGDAMEKGPGKRAGGDPGRRVGAEISPAPISEQYRAPDRTPLRSSPLAAHCREQARRLFPVFQQLLLHGVQEETVLNLMAAVARSTGPRDLMENIGVFERLMEALSVMGLRGRKIKVGAGNQKFVVFLGPTGVGKTTTVAKFAAAARLSRKKDRVGLITMDNDRIGAIAQLKIYAKIIGVPLEVVSSRRTLEKSLKRLRSRTVIFVDTPGFSRGGSSRMEELQSLLSLLDPMEMHLILSAATHEREYKHLRTVIGNLHISSVIFSKIDECSTYGGILNYLIGSDTPFSYFTNSQHVPGGIVIASLERIVKMLVNAESEKCIGALPPEVLAENRRKLENRLRALAAGPEVSDLYHFDRALSFEDLLETAGDRKAYGT